MKTVSIIIPVKEINDYIRESLAHINKLDYDPAKVEVIILPDNPGKISGKFRFKTKIIPTGRIYPGEKRDIGIKNSKGAIVAFIDDDVFPMKQWLKKAVELFESSDSIAAVGGPAATPENDSFLKKVSGDIYSSFLGGGGCRYRYTAGPRRDVDDYPSCNLIIRRDVLKKIGGFNTEFWPGEDTVICLKIVRDLKMRIVYDPEVFVYHHRRDFPGGHLAQVTSYARHRGYFVKRFPETSLKPGYFVPTAFVAYLISFIYPVCFNRGVLLFWSAPLALYVLLLLADGTRTKNFARAIVMMAGIFVNHVAYGICFVQGLLAGKLGEESKAGKRETKDRGQK
ncbi:MAG: glycosyltransferase [Spirochaetia bacterium]|nr:glycosyltransferase [Spirochaetia bacterium]